MSVATYATVNGRLVQENRDGVVTRYVADTLGSVIQTRDAAGNQTSTTTYWPFGEVRTSSGTNPSPWGFCGIWGYYRDALARLYVRARCYRPREARWNTLDPLWPTEGAYTYCACSPAATVDPQGSKPGRPGTIKDVLNCRKLSKGACFWCAYRLFSNRDRLEKGFNYCPQKACDEANRFCGSRGICGPCGPGPVDPPPPGNECDEQAAEQYGKYLRLRCGGMGADKLAHCVKGCLIKYCGGIVGVCAWRWSPGIQDVEQDDSDAEAVGISIYLVGRGDVREKCLRACAKEMYDWRCDG